LNKPQLLAAGQHAIDLIRYWNDFLSIFRPKRTSCQSSRRWRSCQIWTTASGLPSWCQCYKLFFLRPWRSR